MLNNDDCGCGNTNMSILNQNMNNQQMRKNNPMVNNQGVNNHMVNNQQVNNHMANNQMANNQAVNNNMANNNQGVNNPIANNNQQINNQQKKLSDNDDNMKGIRLILVILAALSINEAVKYFINKSIRLNNGTSSMYLYYAIICVAAVFLYNLLL